jgi:hypothetical protein
MKINMYVIYDAKAQMYNKPFYMHNDAIAQRALADLRMDPATDVSRYPEDFILFSIGSYEDTTAEIEKHEPRVICRAHEIQLPTLQEVAKQEAEQVEEA